MKKRILYIGNNLGHQTKYTPQLTTLTNFLKLEKFDLVIASSYMNKFQRILDMVWTVIKYHRSTSFILLDTFGASNFYFAVLIAQFARIFRVPYIPILRGGNLPKRFNKNPVLTRLLFRYAFRNITPSGYLKSAIEEHGYRAEIIPNIININSYKFKLRKSYAPKLLYVRAFHHIYNPTMAIRVLDKIQKKYPDASLCMIGPEKDSSFLETKALAEKLGVSNSIEYTGVLSKIEWHKKSEEYDIFINTTTIDNTPVSVMEAMALGLPVISTNVGGIPYLLKDGIDALLVESNDHEAMAAKVISIIDKKIEIDTIVLNARQKVEQFDWGVVRTKWLALLNSTPIKKGIIDAFYDSSPLFIQNALISLYGIYWKRRRLGGKFKSYLKSFQYREKNYTKKQWEEYQTNELRKLLIHAFSNVSFYKEKYSKAGFELIDFEKFELNDLNKLPYLEKDELRRYGKSTLLASTRSKGAFFESSGSTGTPVSIYFSKEAHRKWQAAYEIRVRNWAGVHSKMARGMIGGRRILNPNRPKKPFYRFNSVEKQTYFSAYYINEKNAPNYVEGMRKHNLDYMVGYAMSLYLLADIINKLDLKAPKLKAVLTSSEKLTRQMRVAIEKAFQCKVYDAYSGVEACGLISENNDGELLFSPDTGIMEVVNENGKEVENGESGEVIATGLLNFDQPLIRYRIGDTVQKSDKKQSKSGIELPIIESIEGRVEDVIVAKDGREMVRFHGLFLDIPDLIAGQVVQNSLSEIQLNIVAESSFNKENESIMATRLRNLLGEVSVQFQYLDAIPKNKNGKFQAVISHL